MTEQPLSYKIEKVTNYEINNFVHPAVAVDILEVEDVKQSIQEFLKELKSLVLRSLSYNEEIVLNRIDAIAKQNFGTLVEDGRNI